MPRTAILLLSMLLILSLLAAGHALGAARRAGLAEPLVHEREGYYDIEIRTGLADYLFSTEAGELKSAFLYFAPYGQRKDEMIADATTDPKSLSRSFAPEGIFPFTLRLAGLNLEGPWEYRLLKREEEMVQLEFAKAAGALTVKKIYTIHDDPSYTVDCELILSNSGGTELSIAWLKLLLGTDQFQVLLGKFVTGEVRYLFDGERTETVPASYGRFDGLGVVAKSAVLFLKLGSQEAGFAPSLELDGRGRKVLGIRAEGLELSPGEERHYRFILYAGRPKWALLRLSGLERLVDVGPFSWALIGIVGFLDWLYAATGNYGWAIILFTIVVRIILFPLMRKQYYSMAKMQRLGPRLQQLQQRYKDERELLQKKMMELYRKEGINPLSGCLPLLIQFPILYVLWQAILYSAERVHLSPGFLWMADLSVADPYYIIVVLNVLAMILQSWLFTPTTGGQRPNWLLILGMPIFMGFLLKSFPAGMWLYWLFTTILQIGQQWLINRELGRLGPVALEPEVGPGEGSDEARN